MSLQKLKQDVCEANRLLGSSGLAPLTWGNASGIDRERGVFAIKPSGVAYDALESDHIVVLDLDCNVVEGSLNPSSDSPTHAVLYKAFPDIGGVVHTHSKNATALCQMGVALPCLGTTHADSFAGTVPLARVLTPDEVQNRYVEATGDAIVEAFAELDPLAIPGVLVHHHAPFAWGPDVQKAFENALVLDICAEMALAQLAAGRTLDPIPAHLSAFHWNRKHGSNATYGQR